MLNSSDPSLLSQAEFSQPICTAIQISLVDLLSTWSITPSSVVGHSSGEIAAAYAAGVLTSSEAIIVAYYRGWVCKVPHQKAGGMAAIGLGRKDVEKYMIIPGVDIACENSGENVTISGDLEALEEVMKMVKEAEPGVLVRRLVVEIAYHSRKFIPDFVCSSLMVLLVYKNRNCLSIPFCGLYLSD